MRTIMTSVLAAAIALTVADSASAQVRIGVGIGVGGYGRPGGYGYGPGPGYGGYGPYRGYGYGTNFGAGFGPIVGPGFGYPYSYGAYNGYYRQPVVIQQAPVVVMPSYAPPVVIQTPAYSSPAVVAPPSNDTAEIRVFVPDPNATVWLGNSQMTSTGTARLYRSPPLAPGQTFTYTIRASWADGGQTVTAERTVPVNAGAQAVVDFTRPTGNK